MHRCLETKGSLFDFGGSALHIASKEKCERMVKTFAANDFLYGAFFSSSSFPSLLLFFWAYIVGGWLSSWECELSPFDSNHADSSDLQTSKAFRGMLPPSTFWRQFLRIIVRRKRVRTTLTNAVRNVHAELHVVLHVRFTVCHHSAHACYAH